jgi:hypothetical protein
VESSGKQWARKGTGKVYRIVVRGELSERYAVAFEGMEMETETGRTILTGVIDQPGLHGIFERINGLGLELLRAESCPEKTIEQAGSGGGTAAPEPADDLKGGLPSCGHIQLLPSRQLRHRRPHRCWDQRPHRRPASTGSSMTRTTSDTGALAKQHAGKAALVGGVREK